MILFNFSRETSLTFSSPQGVGAGKKPPLWLKDGDIVEVGLEGIGTCINKIEHLKSRPKL